jgi:hypothetical protein
MRAPRNKSGVELLGVAVITLGILAAADSALGPRTDSARLVSTRQSPVADVCAWGEDPAGADSNEPDSLPVPTPSWLMASLLPGNLLAALVRPTPEAMADTALVPVRTIRDTHPTYSAIAVDVRTNEVILQDNNLWSYRVFDRLENTPAGVEMTQPKRIVQGDKTALQFNNGLYVDPVNGDIYSVESDTGDKLVVFSNDANGNVAPKRILNTPHRVYNIAVNEAKDELLVTVEYPSEIVVYRKGASGDERPLRRIQGDNTGLDAPHGIAVDEKNQLLYVNAWGHHSNFRVPGTGKFYPPSIKVYPLDASGDTPPLRVIQGDQTEMNWPAAMKLNPETGELYVANVPPRGLR